MVEPIRLTILGHPYVKKSNQGLQRRGNRTVKVNTKVYNEWLREANKQMKRYGYDPTHGSQNKELAKLAKSLGIKAPLIPAQVNEPINLQLRFYLKTAGRVDLSALYEGIQDLLVSCGVLEDDNYKIVASHDGSGAVKDAENPRIEVTITSKGDTDVTSE